MAALERRASPDADAVAVPSDEAVAHTDAVAVPLSVLLAGGDAVVGAVCDARAVTVATRVRIAVDDTPTSADELALRPLLSVAVAVESAETDGDSESVAAALAESCDDTEGGGDAERLAALNTDACALGDKERDAVAERLARGERDKVDVALDERDAEPTALPVALSLHARDIDSDGVDDEDAVAEAHDHRLGVVEGVPSFKLAEASAEAVAAELSLAGCDGEALTDALPLNKGDLDRALDDVREALEVAAAEVLPTPEEVAVDDGELATVALAPELTLAEDELEVLRERRVLRLVVADKDERSEFVELPDSDPPPEALNATLPLPWDVVDRHAVTELLADAVGCAVVDMELEGVEDDDTVPLIVMLLVNGELPLLLGEKGAERDSCAVAV